MLDVYKTTCVRVVVVCFIVFCTPASVLLARATPGPQHHSCVTDVHPEKHYVQIYNHLTHASLRASFFPKRAYCNLPYSPEVFTMRDEGEFACLTQNCILT